MWWRRRQHATPTSTYHYLSQRVVLAFQPAGRTDNPDQSVLCHSYRNRELQFRCNLVGDIWNDHERGCLYSARHSSSLRQGYHHRDLNGRFNQIRSGEHRDNAGTHHYISERIVLARRAAGSHYPDQPMLCHSDGNGKL